MKIFGLLAKKFSKSLIKTIEVYTDASVMCVPGSKGILVAGLGVYFGQGDPKNLSEKYTGCMKTDVAVVRAIQVAPDDGSLLKIFTDSQGPLKAFQNSQSSYFPKKSAALRKAIEIRKGPVDIIKLKGHEGNPGNVAADKLARDCARAQLNEAKGQGK